MMEERNLSDAFEKWSDRLYHVRHISKNTMAGLLKFCPKFELFLALAKSLHKEASYYGEEEIIFSLLLFHLVLKLLLFSQEILFFWYSYESKILFLCLYLFWKLFYFIDIEKIILFIRKLFHSHTHMKVKLFSYAYISFGNSFILLGNFWAEI